MTAPATTAPPRERTITEHPSIPAGHLLHSRVTARHRTGTQVEVTARHHRFLVDEPAGLGGADTAANPVEYLLGSLASCSVISHLVWAEKLGIALDGLEVEVSGDLDTRGFFGLDDSVRPGFQGLELHVTFRGPETDDRYAVLRAAVERHCPVLDNLTAGVEVRVTVDPR
jgi:uncharacterized OsmC-like protein